MKNCFRIAAASTLVLAGAAYAQEAPEVEEQAAAPGDIVVTANRRVQSVQDVPISISVLSKDALASSGVTNATQVQLTTPGVNIATGVGAPIIFVRGMGTGSLVAEAAVGLYLDGVYLPYTAAIDTSFLDIERVEVLKGPQGTLYGRNTTAGAINFVSRDPAAEETVEVKFKAGNWGTLQGQAYVSSGPGPISVSVAAQYTHHDPYLKNLVADRPDYNDRKEYGVRARLKAELSDLWTATISADYTEADDFGSIGFVSIYPNNFASNPAQGGNFTLLDNDPRHTYADFPSNGHEVQNYGGSLTIRGDLGFADFVSISGYRNIYQNSGPDSDASDLPLSAFNSQNRFKNWSQEFQLISTPSSSIEWIFGLYAFDLDASFGPTAVFNQGNTGGPRADDANLIVQGRTGTRSYAAYGQITVPLTDAFKLTGGMRYSTEKAKLTEQTVSVPGVGVILSDTPDEKRFNSLDPKVGIQYEMDGQMLYGTYTKGFRSGSYNLGSPGSPGPVRPEKVDAFEIGGKHTISRGLLFNWAAWYYKYDDLQVSRVVQSGSSLFTTQNAASAVSKGVEASLIVNAIDNLSLTLSGSYLDTKYEDFTGAAAFVPHVSGYGLTRVERDVSGLDLPRAPKFTLSAQATYTIPIGDGSLDLSGNVYYTSSYFLDTPSDIRQDGYELVNLSATYNLPGDRWSIGAFVTNLTDSVYATYHNTNVYGFGAIPSDPRIIGGMISFKY
ncbi:MAG: TonB-dependent receptor [Novosphingobium sp.]